MIITLKTHLLFPQSAQLAKIKIIRIMLKFIKNGDLFLWVVKIKIVLKAKSLLVILRISFFFVKKMYCVY
jgi:hypothetical protein